jgi:AcrR family transcriptional regulator
VTTKNDDDSPFVAERLIRSTVGLIAEEGCRSLGVRRLAQAADRSSMCIYTKFGSRSGLLAAVYERVSSDLLAALALPGAGTPAQKYEDWALENRRLYGFLFDEPLDALDLNAEIRVRLLTDVLALLESGQDADAVDEWASRHGAISYQRIMADAQASADSDAELVPSSR